MVHPGFRLNEGILLLSSLFWPLLKQEVFFEAAGAVVSAENQTTITKLSWRPNTCIYAWVLHYMDNILEVHTYGSSNQCNHFRNATSPEAVFLFRLGTSSFPGRHEVPNSFHIPRASLWMISFVAWIKIRPQSGYLNGQRQLGVRDF